MFSEIPIHSLWEPASKQHPDFVETQEWKHRKDTSGRPEYKMVDGAYNVEAAMYQGGDYKGNSAEVEFVFKADQPIEAWMDPQGKAHLRIIGSWEIGVIRSFLQQVLDDADRSIAKEY